MRDSSTAGWYAAPVLLFFLPILLSQREGLLRRLFTFIGLLIGLIMLLAIPPMVSAWGHLEQSQARLVDLMQSRDAPNLARVESQLDSARLLAITARTELESPLVFGARSIPVLGVNIRAAKNLATAVSMIIPQANQSLAAVESLVSSSPGRTAVLHKGRLDVARVEQLSAPLEAAAAGARSAVLHAQKIDGPLVPPLRKALTQFSSAGGKLAEALGMSADAARLLAAVAGEKEPRRYFLMIQNGSEQRATGGLLGAFAMLHADKGQLSLERFQANSALPAGAFAPAPSKEFADRYDRFQARGAWHNVNMTPDFPTVSRMITELWQRRTGQPVDGVFAIDAVGLSHLLTVTGPIIVPELSEQITSGNFVRMALNEAYIRFPQKRARVDFLLPIGAQVWGRLLAGERLDSRVLIQAFGRSFASKHVQVWTQHESKILRRLGIDGGLKRPGDRDYLLVVGQNAAGNKVDFYARRRISYRVEIGRNGKTSAQAQVALENRAPSSGLPKYILGPFGRLPDPPGLNRSYLSLYVPPSTATSGAQINGRPVGVESHSERGLGVVSRYVETPSGESSRLGVHFRSELRRQGEYRLLLQRQPGLYPDSAEISVKVPDGTVVTGMSEGMRLSRGRVVWRGRLTRDEEFFVRFSSSLYERLRATLFKSPVVAL